MAFNFLVLGFCTTATGLANGGKKLLHHPSVSKKASEKFVWPKSEPFKYSIVFLFEVFGFSQVWIMDLENPNLSWLIDILVCEKATFPLFSSPGTMLAALGFLPGQRARVGHPGLHGGWMAGPLWGSTALQHTYFESKNDSLCSLASSKKNTGFFPMARKAEDVGIALLKLGAPKASAACMHAFKQ